MSGSSGKCLFRILLGGILGGAILFFWSFLSWMVLPWHDLTMHKFGNPETALEMFQHEADRPGVYVAKKESADTGQPEMGGPLILAVYQPQMDADMKGYLIRAGIVDFIAATLGMCLLMATRLNYTGRVMFLTTFALAASASCYVPNWIWWGYSLPFVAVECADLLVGWSLAGLLMAALSSSGSACCEVKAIETKAS